MRATIATEVGVEIATTGARVGVPEGRQDDAAEDERTTSTRMRTLSTWAWARGARRDAMVS
jgi:hypothetical protein